MNCPDIYVGGQKTSTNFLGLQPPVLKLVYYELIEKKGKEPNRARSLRGGSWNGEALGLVCSARSRLDPGSVIVRSIGFRVLRSES